MRDGLCSDARPAACSDPGMVAVGDHRVFMCSRTAPAKSLRESDARSIDCGQCIQ